MAVDVFRAISEPTRRAILDRLAAGEVGAGSLAAEFPMTASAVSQHLKVLRDAGLVEVRRQGRARLYRLAPGGLREAHDWLEHYRAFWEDRFDVFAELVEQHERGPS